MKKSFLLVILMLTANVAFSQLWFQASMEHKFNKIAGLSVSNEVGYNFNFPNYSAISPSVDYTYFSDGNTTQTLLFECLTATYFFPVKIADVVPYFSVTGSHLDAFLSPVFGENVKHQASFGGSLQLGTGFMATKNTQLFFQYRYFTYGDLLHGQLVQFGFMYTLGG